VPDRLAVARQPRRAVREVTLVLLFPDRQAEVRSVVAAVHALAALRREERDDVVAGRDVLDTVTDTLDDACAFVAEHGRQVPRRISARRCVQVCVADTAGHEPDEHLAGLRLRKVELLNLQR
jgi:hypothetical protein